MRFISFVFYIDEEKCQNTQQETQSGKTDETKNQSGTGSENTPRSSRPSTPFETQQVSSADLEGGTGGPDPPEKSQKYRVS